MSTRSSPDISARTRRLLALEGGLANAVEIDRGTLYFVCLPEGRAPLSPRNSDDEGQGGLFCGTDKYVYKHFFADFGPLHLGHLHAFCRRLRQMMECREQEGNGRDARPVYVYSSDHPHRRSNAVVLVLAYAVRFLCFVQAVCMYLIRTIKVASISLLYDTRLLLLLFITTAQRTIATRLS